MPKHIANYVGLSTVLEQTGGNKGFWNLIDQFYFKSRDEWAISPITATGGTVTTAGGKTIHTFTSPGTFTVTSASGDVEYLVVGCFLILAITEAPFKFSPSPSSAVSKKVSSK